ncbi:7-carboxy-7-deazaguanine synthase, partial [Liberibacter sp. Z1]|nr:7-carboxy-7-deazaguanine synthase [Candidatus Liberibacter sp.]
MKTYSVKEIFLTLQGEGAHAGRVAVFCRFSGCNLWSGREEDRATAQCCFCDTDFVGITGSMGGRYSS